LPVKPEEEAVIVDVPAARPFAIPAFTRIDAVADVPELHVIVPGTGCVEPSLRSSTAVKSAVAPATIVGFAGEIFSETGTTAPPTASTTPGETIVPSVAVMVLPPALTPVASPVEAPIVATDTVADAQVTDVVMSTVLASV